MSSHGDSHSTRRLTHQQVHGARSVFWGNYSGVSGTGYGNRAVCSKPVSRVRRHLNGPTLRPLARFPSIRPKDGVVLRSGKASEPETIRPWELRSNSKQQTAKQTVQPIHTSPSITESEIRSGYNRRHQRTQKGPARQRKSLVVILRLPKRKKSLIVTLPLTKDISRTFDDCRTNKVAGHSDDRKRRKRKLCSDLTDIGAASKDDTAELVYPSPISVQSTSDKSTWTSQRCPFLRNEAAPTALPADGDSRESWKNHALTQFTIERECTPWIMRPPIVPIDIYASGHPLFVITGNVWLDSM
ncbi:MAG: hypothetical protein LQ339_005076 [Xanthoria mediterranea]|nr:MAG: hypothetical protein LQ339_005076 [Xanthoria mediterranea]